MPMSSIWFRRAAASCVAGVCALAGGCAGQGLDARPSMFGATCVPGDRDATAAAPPSPGASLFHSVELMPTFAATCRPGLAFTRVELARGDETHAQDWVGLDEARPMFKFAMFGASCSPAQRGFDVAMLDVRVADVPTE